MVSSHIDDIVDFKYRALSAIKGCQQIIALISDEPNIDIDNDYVDKWEDHIKDYDYVDDTTVQDGAYVTVECEMRSLDTATMKTMVVYVHVICAKGFMQIKKFNGLKGNRRDNLIRWCDTVLNGDFGYGVGTLQLEDVTITSVPDGFTSMLATYTVPNFA